MVQLSPQTKVVSMATGSSSPLMHNIGSDREIGEKKALRVRIPHIVKTRSAVTAEWRKPEVHFAPEEHGNRPNVRNRPLAGGAVEPAAIHVDQRPDSVPLLIGRKLPDHPLEKPAGADFAIRIKEEEIGRLATASGLVHRRSMMKVHPIPERSRRPPDL